MGNKFRAGLAEHHRRRDARVRQLLERITPSRDTLSDADRLFVDDMARKAKHFVMLVTDGQLNGLNNIARRVEGRAA